MKRRKEEEGRPAAGRKRQSRWRVEGVEGGRGLVWSGLARRIACRLKEEFAGSARDPAINQ